MKLFAISLLCAGALFGQDAQLSGLISDSSHAVIPNAQVTAVNIDNGLKRSSQSNHEGYYTVPLLPPGNYSITVRMTGFQTAERDQVVLTVEQNARIDFTLQVGKSEQVVNVTAETPLIASDPSVTTIVTREFVENLPLNGRSFQSLISLTPGVVATSSSSGVGQFSFNGQRSDANYWMIDGVSSNVGGGNGLGSQGAAGGGSGVQVSAAGGFNNMVSVDALEEFKIETSTFAPEHGRLPGGQISIVTRSGSNGFHGAASDYVRNTLFDANNWLNDANRIAKPPEHHNDYGGVVGGPIVKNKVFFFFSYEGQRLAVPTSIANVSVPSVSARQRAVPVLQPILNAFPLPNVPQCVTGTTGCDPNVGLFNAAYSNRVVLDASALRLDWNVSTKMTIFARGNDAPSSGVSRNSPPSAYNVTAFGLKTLTVGQTYILRPTMTSDLRFNYTYAPSTSRGLLDDFGGAVPIPDSILYNVPGFNASNSSWSWGGRLIGSIGVSATGNAHTSQYNVIENFSWVHGKHQMKFGVDFRKIEPYAASALYSQGYSYNLTTDSWINNVPSQYNTSTMQPKHFSYYQTGVYAQDNFKVTPRLTLNYGLRWDVNPPPGAAAGQHLQALNVVDASSPASTHIQPDGTPIYRTEWNAFAPRVGFAYQLSNSRNWGRVFRGGYGIFFDTGGVAAGAAVLQFSTVIFPNPPAFPVPSSFTTPPIPVSSPPWGFVSTVDPKFRLPYTHQWNVAVEQALGAMQSLSVTYAAALGRNLARRELYPSDAEFPQGFYAIGNASYSNYHSLQLQFQRRLSHGLQALVAYTWAHSLDTASIQISGNAISRFSEPVGDYYGNSDFDIRHSFQTALTYSIPSPSHQRFVDAVLGHWGVDTIFRIRSANPIDLSDGNAYLAAGQPFLPGTTTTNPAGIKFNPRPTLIAGVPIYLSDPNVPGGVRLNRAAFVTYPANTVLPAQGTLGRNYLRGFGWNQVDLTVRRDFPIHEKIKLQFRADFFNLMNHPSFYFFSTTPLALTSQTFGIANATLNNGLVGPALIPQGQSSLFQIGGPRSIQFSLKLVF